MTIYLIYDIRITEVIITILSNVHSVFKQIHFGHNSIYEGQDYENLVIFTTIFFFV